MDIKNVLSYLKEELKDIPAKADNIHYTNLENLYYILQSGIKGQDYYHIKTDRTKPDDFELATVRGSHNLSNTEKRSLSSNVDRGGVKINLYTNRILASLRGARKAPIAELPKQRETFLKRDKERFKENFGFEIPELFDSNKSAFTDSSNRVADERKIVDWMKENHPSKLKEHPGAVDEIYSYNRSLYHLKKELISREREERFLLKKSIPMDPNLIEIVLEIKPEEYSEYDREFIEEVAKNYLHLLDKHYEVFVDNRNFRLFRNYLRSIIK